MLPSRRMNGRNDQEEQWNRMRSVCTQWCDKFTGVSVIHNGRPQRCAVPPWAWDSGTALRDSAFLSIYLSPICLPVCLCSPSKLRCRSHTNANSGTRYMRASIWTPARNQHSSLCSYPLLAALMYLPPPPPSGHILFTRPVEVSLFGSRHRSVCADPACYRVLTTKMQWPCFPWLAPVEIITCWHFIRSP